MKHLSRAVIALIVGIAAAPSAAKPRLPTATEAILADLHTAAACDQPRSPLRHWCLAADGWATGTPAALPTGKVLIGVTLTREVASVAPLDVRDEAISRFVTLTLRRNGADVEAKLAGIDPGDDSDRRMLRDATTKLLAVLQGKSKVARLPRDLDAFTKSGADREGHAVTKGPRGWTWTAGSATELRKVGKYWVAIETSISGRDTRFITILTEKWK